MTNRPRWRRSAPRLLAAGVLAGTFALARIPPVPAAERTALAARYRFTPITLPELPGSPGHTVRRVHPALTRIDAWISSLGAGVALADLDGDGLPNDLCAVDPRSDRVIVGPAPGTGARYAEFALAPADPRPFVVPTGCVPGDVDEDGRADLVVLYWGRPPVAWLRLPAATTLAPASFTPVAVWDAAENWNTNTGTLADLDGDGHVDLIVGNYFPDSVRLLDPAATGDAPMNHSMSRAYNGGRNRLLLWAGATRGDQPTVRFRDASSALSEEALRGWTHAVGAADLDRDGLPELFLVNDFGPDRLFHNESVPGRVELREVTGRRGWTTPASRVLGRDSFKGMGVDFGDLNGDLVPDIYVSNIALPGVAVESHFLFMSEGPIDDLRRGVAPYVDRSEPLGLSRSGWGWDCKLADFDDDGVLEAVQATGFIRGEVDRWPEVHELSMANDELLPRPSLWPRFRAGDDVSGHEHTRFFARRPGGAYADVAVDLGLQPIDPPWVGRGIAIADVDGDGDLDFALAHQWGPVVFYRNESPPAGRSLNLRVVLPVDGAVATGGPIATRPAVGATVIVRAPDGRRFTSYVDGGNGHTGRRSPDVHVGVGKVAADAPLETTIVWRDRSGRHEQTTTLTPGWHTVTLGRGATP